MFKKTMLLCGLVCATTMSYAQFINKPSYNGEYDHLIGIQVNPLFQQILNLGNNQAVDNPYLLRYSRINTESLREWNLGLGVSLNTNKDEDGAESNRFDFNLRTGVAQTVKLSKRFEVSYGVDLIYNNLNIHTLNIQAFTSGFGTSDSTINESRTKTIAFGAGPRLNLTFNINDKVSIGTEATYYYTYNIDELWAISKTYRTGTGGFFEYTENEEEQKNKGHDLDLRIPVALFLTIRL